MSELKWCGYCESWHSKPCGEGCHWSPTDQTVADMVARSGMKPVYVKQWRTIILVPESLADRALALSSGQEPQVTHNPDGTRTWTDNAGSETR